MHAIRLCGRDFEWTKVSRAGDSSCMNGFIPVLRLPGTLERHVLDRGFHIIIVHVERNRAAYSY
jgi:hypothetical protein